MILRSMVVALAMVWSLCVYAGSQPEPVSVTIVTDTRCSYCSYAAPEAKLKELLPGAKIKALDYRSRYGRRLLKEHQARTLPFFLIDGEMPDTALDNAPPEMLDKSGNAFVLDSKVAGIFLFLERPYVEGKMDYFFDFYDVRTKDTFPVLVEFCRENNVDLNIHFIVPTIPVSGYPAQEIAAALAVKEIYPQALPEYLSERIKSKQTIDCITSFSKLGMDSEKLLARLAPETASAAVRDNLKIIEDLGITNGNAVLVNNRRLFMIFGADKKDFARVWNRQ